MTDPAAPAPDRAAAPARDRAAAGPGALVGLRVLDAGQVIAGPMVGQLLGDFGAEVIKIEEPGAGDPYRRFGPSKDGVPLGWTVLARNKKSITLNLRAPRGIALFRQLVGHVDVVIQSFRPSTVERCGLTYEELSALNPRVVVLYVSGFGQNGPYRDRPGFGTLIEAMSGYADLTGAQDGPPTLPQFALADGVAALYGAFAVMNALYWRDSGGGQLGQAIDLSLLEPLASILGPLATFHEQIGLTLTRMGSRNWANAPRNVYAASDGKWIAIAASVQQIAARCFAAVGRPELIEDPRFATAADRLAHVDEVDEIIGAWVGARSSEEALKVLQANDVAAAPVMDIEALMADPHVRARGMFTQVTDPDLGPVSMQDVVPAMSRTPGRITAGGPRVGQHNAEVYGSLLGLTEADLQVLRDDHVI